MKILLWLFIENSWQTNSRDSRIWIFGCFFNWLMDYYDAFCRFMSKSNLEKSIETTTFFAWTFLRCSCWLDLLKVGPLQAESRAERLEVKKESTVQEPKTILIQVNITDPQKGKQNMVIMVERVPEFLGKFSSKKYLEIKYEFGNS